MAGVMQKEPGYMPECDPIPHHSPAAFPDSYQKQLVRREVDTRPRPSVAKKSNQEWRDPKPIAKYQGGWGSAAMASQMSCGLLA